MTDNCCSVPSAGCDTCELPSPSVKHSVFVVSACPVCHEKGKPVQGQTVKALLSVTLRQLRNTEYLFCKTQTCAVVYFSSDGEQAFTTEQVRERVYQKEPSADDVFVCYCFRHTVGNIRSALAETRFSILDDINTGIQANQCACDLRNPQGSCCLGNVRGLIKRVEQSTESAK